MGAAGLVPWPRAPGRLRLVGKAQGTVLAAQGQGFQIPEPGLGESPSAPGKCRRRHSPLSVKWHYLNLDSHSELGAGRLILS